MKDRRILSEFDPKPEIRRNAENAVDWEYHEEAEYLYGMANLFKDRFLDPILHTDRGRLPDPVISFKVLSKRKTLAAYTLHRNAFGLLDEFDDFTFGAPGASLLGFDIEVHTSY